MDIRARVGVQDLWAVRGQKTKAVSRGPRDLIGLLSFIASVVRRYAVSGYPMTPPRSIQRTPPSRFLDNPPALSGTPPAINSVGFRLSNSARDFSLSLMHNAKLFDFDDHAPSIISLLSSHGKRHETTTPGSSDIQVYGMQRSQGFTALWRCRPALSQRIRYVSVAPFWGMMGFRDRLHQRPQASSCSLHACTPIVRSTAQKNGRLNVAYRPWISEELPSAFLQSTIIRERGHSHTPHSVPLPDVSRCSKVHCLKTHPTTR